MEPATHREGGSAGPAPVRLRRPVLARLLSSPLQALLTLYAAASVATVVAALAGKADARYWYLYLIDAFAFLLWLRGVTAWAQVDGVGIRWRYWQRYDLPWHEVSRVALGQRARVFAVGPGPDIPRPAILVRSHGDDEVVRPALGCGRHRRTFGAAVLHAAAAHRTRTEVVGRHWGEQPTADEAPYA